MLHLGGAAVQGGVLAGQEPALVVFQLFASSAATAAAATAAAAAAAAATAAAAAPFSQGCRVLVELRRLSLAPPSAAPSAAPCAAPCAATPADAALAANMVRVIAPTPLRLFPLGSWLPWQQGLTLVHFSAQLEPCLTHKNSLHTINTPEHPLNAGYAHPLSQTQRSS